jgi:flagellar motor switch protein FliN
MTAQFAALLTGETAEASEGVSTDPRAAAAELIQQICGNAADRLRNTFGQLELKPRVAVEREQSTGSRLLIMIPHEKDALEFELHIVRLATVQPNDSPHLPDPQSTPTPAFALPAGGNLDLLLDIELNASLRFGTRQMILKDIIELCSGSVVELDRRVQDPVDLLIDGKVIAQGEVVIVEGNYGLRILQVATPGEKVACLP